MNKLDINKILAERFGIASPNAMQSAVWASDAGRLIVIAPTGSGKTIAFTGAMLQRLSAPSGKVQALILAPSRELVLQIYDVVQRLAQGYKTTALYGKHSMADEATTLSVTPDIVVATPGRLLDHLERGTLKFDGLKVLVIDEYDKALELGFHKEMRRIARNAGKFDNIILTSATEIAELPDFIDMANAETVSANARETDPRQRMQIAHIESPARDKLQTLEDLLNSLDDNKVLIFVNHRESAERVYGRLRKDGLPVGLYHGGLEQVDRERAVILLNNGTTPVLVSTDLGARGLDIDSVGTVVHYHMPPSPEAWTHRNGRTARVNASGNVYVISSEGENIPEYVVWNRDYNPTGKSTNPLRRSTATLHINAGRKEKISRGDIVGFLVNNLDIPANEIGKIDLRDHAAYVAVPRRILGAVAALPSPKIKGKRVKITKFE